MRILKARISTSGAAAGEWYYFSQRLPGEASKPRITSCTVDRGFCPQSLYGIKTYPHKYTLKLGNSDGQLDALRTVWTPGNVATLELFAGDDSSFVGVGTTDLKFARRITRFVVTESEGIIECNSYIDEFLTIRLAEFYPAIYNTFSQNKPQLWAAGRVTVDLDALEIVSSATDFDTGVRSAEVVQAFLDGSPTSTSAAVGAGDFALSNAAIAGKRVAAKLAQPTDTAPCDAGTAFDDIMEIAEFTEGVNYVGGWSRGDLDETAEIGVSARDESCIQIIEKILSGFDAGLFERSDGKLQVALLQDFYAIESAADGYDLRQRKIERIEVENAPFDGLGQLVSWSQNDAVHSASVAGYADTYGLQAAYEQADLGVTFGSDYDTDKSVQERVFQTWFTSQVADVAEHLEGFYSAENMLINVSAPGFDLQDLNPGAKILLTHERFDLGVTPNRFQLLNLRYDMMQLGTSLQLIGKKREFRYFRLEIDTVLLGNVVGVEYFAAYRKLGDASIFAGATATASSEFSGSYPASNALIDNTDSWVSATDAIPAYLQIDLGSSVFAAPLIFEWRAPYDEYYAPKLTRIRASKDGTLWSTLSENEILSYTTGPLLVAARTIRITL